LFEAVWPPPPPPQPINSRLNRTNATNMDLTFTSTSRAQAGLSVKRNFEKGNCVVAKYWGALAPRMQCPLESDLSLVFEPFSTCPKGHVLLVGTLRWL
jgi:hypothetical protein